MSHIARKKAAKIRDTSAGQRRGVACVCDTRIPVATLVAVFADGMNTRKDTVAYPRLANAA